MYNMNSRNLGLPQYNTQFGVKPISFPSSSNLTTANNLGYPVSNYSRYQTVGVIGPINQRGNGRFTNVLKKVAKGVGAAALGALAYQASKGSQPKEAAVAAPMPGPKQRVLPAKVMASLDRMDATVARHKRMAGKGRKKKPRRK